MMQNCEYISKFLLTEAAYLRAYPRLIPAKNKKKHSKISRLLFMRTYRPKRFLKRSTRPPLSTSFCLPVKKG